MESSFEKDLRRIFFREEGWESIQYSEKDLRRFSTLPIFLIRLQCRPTEASVCVVITGCPIITKWGDYSTFNTPTVVLKDIQQLLKC